jgi:peptide/nickel transport system substrate-binding protein
VRTEPFSIAPRALEGGGIGLDFTIRVFNAGLELVDDKGNVSPYMAEALPQLNTDSWRIFPDGRMETRYRLKPNLTWHDGPPFSSEDYAFALRFYTTPELGTFDVPITLIEEVQAPDPRTLIIRWRQPYARAGNLNEGGNPARFPPLPRHVLGGPYGEAQWEGLPRHPYWTREFVGLGPYRVDRWEPGQFIEGSAFEGHVLGRPRLDRIKLIFISDANTTLANLLAGAVHVSADNSIDLPQATTARREWGTQGGGMILSADVWRAVHAQFRPEYVNPRGTLDLRVRRALAHALNKQALDEALFDGQGVMSDTVFPPHLESYTVIDRAIAKYSYDVRRTEQLMAEAGYSRDGDGLYALPGEGRFSPELRTNASSQNEAERSIIADSWRRAGFDIQEATSSAAQARDIQLRSSYRSLYNYGRGLGEAILPTMQTANVSGPENRWTGINRGGWSNPEYDRLVDSLNAVLDRSERLQHMAAIARIMSEELPAIPLYYDLDVIVYRPNVRGPGPITTDTTGLVAWNVGSWELAD